MDPADHKPSGWYPDESTPSQERWWNGISWGDQTRPAKGSKPIASVPMTTPRPVDPYASSAPTPPRFTTPSQSAPGQSAPGQPPQGQPAAPRGQFRRLNQIGYSGVVLAFVSVIFNFFAITSILAIVFTGIGLYRAVKLGVTGRRSAGWIWCIVGLLLAIVETAVYAVNTIK